MANYSQINVASVWENLIKGKLVFAVVFEGKNRGLYDLTRIDIANIRTILETANTMFFMASKEG